MAADDFVAAVLFDAADDFVAAVLFAAAVLSLRRFFSLRQGVERGGFWTGAAHPRRQKHREMPPPGASAPAFAATAEPASSTQDAKPPRQDSSSTRYGTRAGECAASCIDS